MLWVLRRWTHPDEPPQNLIYFSNQELAERVLLDVQQLLPLYTFDLWCGTERELKQEGVIH